MLTFSAVVLRKCVCLLPLALLSLVLPAGSARAATPLFPVEPSVSLPVGSVETSASIVSGDFNGDGLLDTAVAYAYNSSSTTTLMVLLNQRGSAPAQVATTLPGCGIANFVSFEAADVNQDHKLDLVATCRANFLITLLGNGDGTFQAPILTALPGVADYLTLADFNGDGLPDVAYTSTEGNNSSDLGISLNLGAGNFASPQLSAVSGSPEYIASGDFNGDGKQDIIFNGEDGSAAYQLGKGDGTFGAQQALPSNFYIFTVGDFNHDGYSDVAYALQQPNISNGDIAPSPAVVVLLGGSGGIAATGVSIPTNGAPTGGAVPSFLTALDLTGSGNLDLILGQSSGDSFSNTLVFSGDGKGNFSAPVSYSADWAYGVADLNGDGVPDLVGFNGNAAAANLPFAPGNGDGSFQATPNTAYAVSPANFIVADMNGDGIADAILPQEIPLVFIGLGNGRFSPVPQDPALPSVTPAGSFLTVAADFNGDGNIDVASIWNGNTLRLLTNGGILLFLGNGDGTVTFKQLTNLSQQGISNALAGDFNGDKKQDLILFYGSGSTYNAVLLPGNGDGTFGTPQPITLLANDPIAVVAADINGDGISDLVVSDNALGTTAYLGSAGGTLKTTSQIVAVESPVMAVADFTGDGKLDLLVGTGVYSGNGDGTFSSSPLFSLNLTQFIFNGSLVAGDLNGDGLPDIAIQSVTSPPTTSINVFLNQGGTSFSADPVTYSAGSAIYVTSTTSPLFLARLNSTAAAGGSQQKLDALVYTSGGLTSLLNQLNTAPKPSPTVVVSLADGATSITSGATVTVSAAISVIGAVPATGTVAFFAGQTSLGASPITDGSASVSAPIAGSGTVIVRAVYSGDTTYGKSSGFASITSSAPAVTTTTLSASATSVNEQQQVTLTATIVGSSPTGTVTFLNGATSLGTAIIANGSASLPVMFATAGTASITASYGGDANNVASTSLAVVVTVAAPSFAVTASPATATVVAGHAATFTITVTPSGGFASAVALSCGTLPSKATCSFSASSITPASGQPGNVQLTISTTAATANVQQGQNPSGLPRNAPWFPGGGAIALAGLIGLARRGRKNLHPYRLPLQILCLAVALFVAVSVIGCGGSSGSSPTNPGTPAGTSTVSVSATVSGSSTPQSVTVQLVVQ